MKGGKLGRHKRHGKVAASGGSGPTAAAAAAAATPSRPRTRVLKAAIALGKPGQAVGGWSSLPATGWAEWEGASARVSALLRFRVQWWSEVCSVRAWMGAGHCHRVPTAVACTAAARQPWVTPSASREKVCLCILCKLMLQSAPHMCAKHAKRKMVVLERRSTAHPPTWRPRRRKRCAATKTVENAVRHVSCATGGAWFRVGAGAGRSVKPQSVHAVQNVADQHSGGFVVLFIFKERYFLQLRCMLIRLDSKVSCQISRQSPFACVLKCSAV